MTRNPHEDPDDGSDFEPEPPESLTAAEQAALALDIATSPETTITESSMSAVKKFIAARHQEKPE